MELIGKREVTALRGIGKDVAKFCLGASLLISSTISHSQTVDPYVLYTEELPPYSTTQSGQISGLSVEIVSTLFDRAGIPFQIEIVPWQRAYVVSQRLENACLFPIQRTQERESMFHWFSPIMVTQTGFYTLSESPGQIRTLEDVGELKIGTYRGSAVADYLQRLGYDVDLSSDDEMNLKRLQHMRIQVWAADTLTAKTLARQAGLSMLQEQLVFFTSLRSLACNLAMPVDQVARLNDELQQMHRTGVIRRLVSKYRHRLDI